MLWLRNHIQAVLHDLRHGSFAALSLLCGYVFLPLGMVLTSRQLVLTSVMSLLGGYAGRLPIAHPRRDLLGGMAIGMWVMIVVYEVLLG